MATFTPTFSEDGKILEAVTFLNPEITLEELLTAVDHILGTNFPEQQEYYHNILVQIALEAVPDITPENRAKADKWLKEYARKC